MKRAGNGDSGYAVGVCVCKRERPEGRDAPVHTEHSTDFEKTQQLRTPRPSARMLRAPSVSPKEMKPSQYRLSNPSRPDFISHSRAAVNTNTLV